MTKRKSFILHIDALTVLNELSDEQAGQLFKAIKNYHECGESSLTGIMKAIFIPFKNQFDRDNEKYETICERNKNNGLKGGRPKAKVTQNNPVGYSGTQNNPKEPDNDSDSDSKNDSDIINISFDKFYASYPRKIGKEAARKSFSKIKESEYETIIRSVAEFSQFHENRGTEKQYIPHPATWLNGRRWEDDLSAEEIHKHPSQAKSHARPNAFNAARDAANRWMQENRMGADDYERQPEWGNEPQDRLSVTYGND